jgi:hypothetical protein
VASVVSSSASVPALGEGLAAFDDADSAAMGSESAPRMSGRGPLHREADAGTHTPIYRDRLNAIPGWDALSTRHAVDAPAQVPVEC